MNSSGMNGYVHGVQFVDAFAYYKIILIVWDVLAIAALSIMGVMLYKRIKKLKNEEKSK